MGPRGRVPADRWGLGGGSRSGVERFPPAPLPRAGSACGCGEGPGGRVGQGAATKGKQARGAHTCRGSDSLVGLARMDGPWAPRSIMGHVGAGASSAAVYVNDDGWGLLLSGGTRSSDETVHLQPVRSRFLPPCQAAGDDVKIVRVYPFSFYGLCD